MSSVRICVIISLLTIILLPVRAQELPPCTERAHWTFDIRANPELYCVEIVWQDDSAGELGFTGLAFAPDGRLFAARPLQGEVLVFRDTDGDTQPDSPQIAAKDLERPNALLYTNGALYIAGGPALYRLDDDGNLETLADDLPQTALWNGGLATDGTSLYIGTGACDHCDNPQAGAVLRMPLEGGPLSIYATGFRQPLGMLWHKGVLWATDSGRPEWQGLPSVLDEVNRVEEGRDYGYPACYGLTNTPDPAFDQGHCADATPPTMILPTGIQPSALAFYTGDAFPHLEEQALMSLMGSTNRSDVRGYGLIALPVPVPEQVFSMELVVPYDHSITSGDRLPYSLEYIDKITFQDMVYLNRRGVGLWPHHPYGIAISPEGWIYLSVGGGTILSLRPR